MFRIKLAIGLSLLACLPAWAASQVTFSAVEAEYAKSGFGMMLEASNLADEKQTIMAIQEFKKANEKLPNSLINTFSLGETLYEMAEKTNDPVRRKKLLQDAQWAYVRVTNINPDFVLGFYKLSEVTWDLEDYDQALLYIEKGLEEHPKDVILSYSKALALEKLEKRTEAVAAFEMVLEINPKFVFAYNNLAILYEEDGDLANAERIYRNAIDNLASRDKNLFRVNLANLLIEQDKPDEAYPFLLEAQKQEPDNFLVYLALGHVYYAKRDFDRAVSYYAVASELNPEYADTYYYLSLTLDKMNRPDEALTQSIHYISLSPDGDYANAVKDLILSLKEQADKKP